MMEKQNRVIIKIIIHMYVFLCIKHHFCYALQIWFITTSYFIYFETLFQKRIKIRLYLVHAIYSFYKRIFFRLMIMNNDMGKITKL